MITTYRLNVSELNDQLIELIRNAFPGKEIEITVFEQDATVYLASNAANKKHLDEAIKRIENQDGLVTVDISKLHK